MLGCMDPSSPPAMRTFHLLKTPDILLANDNRQTGHYLSVTAELATTLPEQSTRVQKPPSQIDPKGAVHEAEQRCAEEDVPADEMSRMRGCHRESLLRWKPLQQGTTSQDDS